MCHQRVQWIAHVRAKMAPATVESNIALETVASRTRKLTNMNIQLLSYRNRWEIIENTFAFLAMLFEGYLAAADPIPIHSGTNPWPRALV